ncbi:DcrB-related protein [Pseudomonas sp. nanlin1]|uniref:DcrB-related protein n=1 Tax=Pseudomonas sp. nanlin1 TaxID=3040605 RepID=UPI00388ED65B
MRRYKSQTGSMYDRISEQRTQEQLHAKTANTEQKRLAAATPPRCERFITNELSFVRPISFTDKTFHVFTLTDIAPSPFSLVIGRTPIGGDSDLETMTQLLLADLAKSLLHLQWVEPLCPAIVAGIDARRVEFTWRQQGQLVHQLQLIFLLYDEHSQPLLMQVTGTSNHPKGMTPEERSAFYSIVESIQLRQRFSVDDEVATNI